MVSNMSKIRSTITYLCRYKRNGIRCSSLQTEGLVRCSLVSAKAKVAPKQRLSIPRMELMAAVLGVCLANTVCSMHKITISKRVFWSDSNTVLA